MNKTSIYFLSVVVICIVCLSVLAPVIRVGTLGWDAFAAGFQQGYDSEHAQHTELEPETMAQLPMTVQFRPDANVLMAPADSLRVSDGSTYPLILDRAMVMLPETKLPTWSALVSGLALVLSLVLLGFVLYYFIRFIVNISKERIFVQPNVVLLRKFSYCLIAIALVEAINGWVDDYLMSRIDLATEGYALAASWTFPWSNLLIGCVGLLMAQVWARGIETESEHRLTI